MTARAHDFKDEAIDALFAKGRATAGLEERSKVYCTLERRGAGASLLGLHQLATGLFGLRADVKGFTQIPGTLSFLTPTSLEQTWLDR